MAKKVNSLWLAGVLAMALNTLTSNASAQATPFQDIGGSYAQKEINALAAKQIVTGEGNGQFKPSDTMTREDFAIVLSKCLGLTPNASYASGFTDLDSYARPYVGALVHAGLASGYDANTYGGRDPVSRQDLAVFFLRAFGQESFAKQMNLTSTFTDDANISPYAKPLAAMAQRTGFMIGSDNGNGTASLDPNSHADRQAVARLAYEFYVNQKNYTDKFAMMKRVDSLLTTVQQATNAQTGYQMTLDMTSTNAAQPASQHVAADINQNPLVVHETGTITYTDTSGKQNTQPIEDYIQNGKLYLKVVDKTGAATWYYQPYSSPTFNAPGQVGANNLHKLASYLTVTSEDNNTLTLGGFLSGRDFTVNFPTTEADLSGLGSMQYTIVVDKATNLEKNVTTVATQANSGEKDTILVTLRNYSQVPLITLPDVVKNAQPVPGQ